jgi:BASS family bile acid:Na+ symporter
LILYFYQTYPMDNSAALFLASSLFLIMIGMGLSLTLVDFRRVLLMPKAVLMGFLNQIILLPLIGYVLCLVFSVEPAIAVGIMILAACPGGVTSNLITHLAKGDTALSVTLTAVNSLLAIISIPLITNFALGAFLGENASVAAPISSIFGSLLVIVLIPMSLGMWIKHRSPRFAQRMDKPVRIASVLILVLVIVGLTIRERDNIAAYFQQALLISLALNLGTMLIGFLTGRLAQLNFRQALTISIESGNQNGTLAISIAVVSLAQPDFAITAAVYSLIMYPTAALLIMIGNRHSRRVPAPVK